MPPQTQVRSDCHNRKSHVLTREKNCHVCHEKPRNPEKEIVAWMRHYRTSNAGLANVLLFYCSTLLTPIYNTSVAPTIALPRPQLIANLPLFQNTMAAQSRIFYSSLALARSCMRLVLIIPPHPNKNTGLGENH